MKKSLTYVLTTLILILSLTSCAMSERTVTFVLGDGREDITTEVTMNSDLFEPESTDPNKVFGGWFLDAELKQPYLSKNIRDDMTLYAKWVKKGSNSVVFVYGNGQEDATLIYENYIPEPKDPIKSGYNFKGWYNTETKELFDFTEKYQQNLVLEAKWDEISKNVRVTVFENNGTDPKNYTSKSNEPLPMPKTPTKEGYRFVGWYSDSECTKPYDFEKEVTKDVRLYAKWIQDDFEIANQVATETLKSTVKITTMNYETDFFGQITRSAISTGSGVIYKSVNGIYYCLTNNHVVDTPKNLPRTDYIVHDCYGNEYIAELMVRDPAYDLAVLSFKQGKKELKVAKFAIENPKINTLAISIGNPKGLVNSVTYGNIDSYEKIGTVDGESSTVTFEVGCHNAPVDHGSSGGGVFNTDQKLIGINFAAAQDKDGTVTKGFFIPIEKVREFLAKNNLM